MICMWFYNQPYLIKLKKEKLWDWFSALKVTDFQDKLTVETVLLDTTADVTKQIQQGTFTRG